MTENGKPYTTQADLKSWSLRDAKPVTIQATWNPESAMQEWLKPLPERNVVIHGETIRALGVDWWLWKTSFRSMATASVNQDLDGAQCVSMDFNPTSEATMTRAEWWRRLGFYLIARPYDWLVEHTWRPWARWIVRDEVDDFDDED